MRLLLFVFFIFISFNLAAQDIHFSQYYASPLSLNPSMTGFISGEFRAGANFRSQWSSISKPYTTFSGFYDRKFYFNEDHIGAGIYILNDRSGVMRFNVNKIYLSGAYHKKWKKHFFIAGFQPGLVQKGFNENVTYPEQYDPETGIFNPGLPNEESSQPEPRTYLDINAGLLWKFRPNKKILFYAGGTLFHINQPDESLIHNDDLKLPVRKLLYGGGQFLIQEKVTLLPHLLYMRHAGATEFNFGGNFEFALNKNSAGVKSLLAGAYYRNNLRGYQTPNGFIRNNDAIIFVTGMNYKDFEIGLSYDLNISDLYVASNHRGGIEISVIYTHPFDPQPKEKAIPCQWF